MSPQHEVLYNEYSVSPLSSSRTLGEHDVHKHRSKRRQQLNNVPQGQAASSNTRSSSSESHRNSTDDAGNGENGKNFNDHRNKFHHDGHDKIPHKNDDSSWRKGAGGNGETAGRGGNNNDDKDDDCDDSAAKGCVLYDIRDDDPRVHYTGPWVSKATDDATHSTVVEGSTVSLRFNGSAIVVFGTVPASMSEPPTAAYILDNFPPSIATLPYAAADIPNQPLYSSLNLTTTEEHLLFINVTKTTPGAPYALAGFSLSPLSSDSNSSQSSQNTPSATSPSATPTTVPASASATTMSDHKDIRIVAGVLGSLVFLSIVGVVIFLVLRWRMYARRELPERLCSGTSSNRTESVCSVFTTTESILRNDPSIWNPTPSHVSFNEASSRVSFPSNFLKPSNLSLPSDCTGPDETRLSAIQFAPLPSPSKSLSPSTLSTLT